MRDMEVRWVDERLPALGGASPRQALADTRRRADVEALLDDIEWLQLRSGPGEAMDAGRIRALLGLPPRRWAAGPLGRWDCRRAAEPLSR
jgi:hypothetical protein